MNRLKKYITKIVLAAFTVALILAVLPADTAFAADTDEITNYEITVDVNDDATLNIVYHIEWKVLETDGIGPLTWVQVGIPNKKYLSYGSLSDNIKRMSVSTSGGEVLARIDLDREYGKGETVKFDFYVIQDYMYQMNKVEEGYTQYIFTPGWFDDIKVDNYRFRWMADKVDTWSPDCSI